MPSYELYSRRKRRAEQIEPDVYKYDEVPAILPGQIEHIWNSAIGPYYIHQRAGVGYRKPRNNNRTWHAINSLLCRDLGRRSLMRPGEVARNPKDDCVAYLYARGTVDDWFDIVELSFKYIIRLSQLDDLAREELGIEQEASDAINELNFRFREAAFGYRFENGEIVRVDSELIHSEVVKPALVLLSDPRFKGPQDEFLAAHGHYRAGEYKDAVTDANNAFESTLKTICTIKRWEYQKGSRASDLVKIVRRNGLLPDYLDNSFDQLIGTLSSGLPQVRNVQGSHGQGDTVLKTPSYIASYALHLAAAKIVLLVEAMKAIK